MPMTAILQSRSVAQTVCATNVTRKLRKVQVQIVQNSFKRVPIILINVWRRLKFVKTIIVFNTIPYNRPAWVFLVPLLRRTGRNKIYPVKV